ncbi:unnamed protein product [Laminaria digitata]
MSWCCRKRSGMGPTLEDQLREKLSGVELCYPGTYYACLLDLEGNFLSGFFVDGESPQRGEVCAAVAALKRAAEQFGEFGERVDCWIKFEELAEGSPEMLLTCGTEYRV